MVADPKPGFLQTRDSRKPETRVWKKGAGFAFPIDDLSILVLVVAIGCKV